MPIIDVKNTTESAKNTVDLEKLKKSKAVKKAILDKNKTVNK